MIKMSRRREKKENKNLRPNIPKNLIQFNMFVETAPEPSMGDW